MINTSEIAPTKTSLFDFKGQLQFSVDGHSLLEEKREILVLHLTEILSGVRKEREELDRMMADCHRLFSDVTLEMGEFELRKMNISRPALSRLEVREKGVMGVNLPEIRYRDTAAAAERPDVSFQSTTRDYDRLSLNVKAILKKIVIVAQIEASAWRLAYEIKKTQRRVNALENVYIPDFREAIKYIQDILDERERETFFQMKKIKNAHSAETD